MGECCRIGDGSIESLGIADQMIRGQHEHEGVAPVFFRQVMGGECHGRSRVAASRLKQVAAAAVVVEVGQGQLVLAHEIVVAIGDGEDFTAIRHGGRSLVSFLQQALAIGHFHEWLGVTCA